MAHDLASLITVLDGMLHPTDKEDQIPDDHKKPLLESLLEKATSLKNLLEKSEMQHRFRGNKDIIEALEGDIRDAAHEAEDIIESHAVDLMLSKTDGTSRPDHSTSKVMKKFDAANDKLIEMIKDDRSHEEERTNVIVNPSLSAAADPTSAKPNIAMVGFNDDALRLKYRLTSERREREFIPIVGMGGIGKTTLARNLYNDPLIVSHFHSRAWVTVSQDYSVRAILLGLLRCLLTKISDDILKQNDSDLGVTLYQRLYGSRYLIVLDDIWSEKAWDEIKRYFPTEKQRSRILITSRELHVAKYPDSACEEHQMHLLSSAQAWDLLHQKVFDSNKEEPCPPFLEKIGHKIARDCGGLPLAISVIGGLLSANKYSKDLWEQVAKNVSSVLSHRDEHFSKILSLSYDNLPLHLKPCFLYMSAFPEDFGVRGSKLVKLWVAEGFLWRSSGNTKSLEDAGEEYLKALVDRNLISVAGTKSNGRAASYSMHDLLWDLCVRKANEEKFICIFKKGKAPRFTNLRRVSVLSSHHTKYVSDDLAAHLSFSRSLLCNTNRSTARSISPVLSTLRLVRILDLYDIEFKKFPTEILHLANLHFLAVSSQESLPFGIWKLRNLQTLMARGHYHIVLPYEAWEISGLRHIMLQDTTIYIHVKVPRIQEMLQTIYAVHLHDLLVSNLLNSIPNVKKLEIRGNGFDFQDRIVDLSHLRKLEILKLVTFSVDVLSRIRLPDCLKKLSLFGCKILMGLFNVDGALENVEVLKIEYCKFREEEEDDDDDDDSDDDDDDDDDGDDGDGDDYDDDDDDEDDEDDDDDDEDEDNDEDIGNIDDEDDDNDLEEDDDEEEEEAAEWEISEGVEFSSLQYLELNDLDIVRWKADSSQFPRLRHLNIRYCSKLKEIPTSIGEIETLEMIEVDDINPYIVAWAEEIQDIQRCEYGNETLQIRIHSKE